MNTGEIKKILDGHIAHLETRHLEQGRTWYAEAHRQAEELARRYNKPVSTVCAIIAVLSPGTKWTSNIGDAEAVLQDGGDAVITGYGQNKDKALRILAGTEIEDTMKRRPYRGNKVLSFYHNILNPDGQNRVTLDRWMIRLFDGQVSEREIFESLVYFDLSDLVINAARVRGLIPAQLQAALWLYSQERGTQK